MGKRHPLMDIVRLQKGGRPVGICSICSSNPYVIKAAVTHALRHDSLLLIESTSNQVNQYGGYTGMTPMGFRRFVEGICRDMGFDTQNLILGGDHLGPNPWKAEAAGAALEKACKLVKAYVLAGFTKIHIDASMLLAGDEVRCLGQLDPKIAAERSALLCQAAEKAYHQLMQKDPDATPPVYIIGTEVPVPGGTADEEKVKVTDPADFHQTVALTRQAFFDLGLGAVWDRVVGVVVQPGVEFSKSTIHEYDRKKARELSEALKAYENLVFEGHSTDYQRRDALRQLVEDGVAILKVGPALTFTVREAVFLLSHMEQEVFKKNGDLVSANVPEVLDAVMQAIPRHWEGYYRGSNYELEFARKYSFADRARYYWNHPDVQNALSRLIANLRGLDIPLALLSQYMPKQYERVRYGILESDPEALIIDRVCDVLEDYRYAVQMQ